jgi:hypothetical protein
MHKTWSPHAAATVNAARLSSKPCLPLLPLVLHQEQPLLLPLPQKTGHAAAPCTSKQS